MEKVRNLATLLYITFGLNFAFAHETYMAPNQAQKKFGAKPFSQEQFKKGDRKLRGEMAADLIFKKTFVGKPIKSVLDMLGSPDGYFENKGIPAYIISPNITKKDIWQIVFLPDEDWKKVDEVKIHKNCCD